MSLKKKDQDAIAKLYIEGFDGASDGPEDYAVDDAVNAILNTLERTMRREDIKSIMMIVTDPKNLEEVRYIVDSELGGKSPQYYDDDQY
jgi:hypothetical protein